MKQPSFGQELIATMSEGLTALRQGHDLRATYRPALPALPTPPALTAGKVAGIRASYGMTQRDFSRIVMVSPKTIQSWEQGTRKPSGAALRILQILQTPETLDPIIAFRAMAAKQNSKIASAKGSAKPNRAR